MRQYHVTHLIQSQIELMFPLSQFTVEICHHLLMCRIYKATSQTLFHMTAAVCFYNRGQLLKHMPEAYPLK